MLSDNWIVVLARSAFQCTPQMKMVYKGHFWESEAIFYDDFYLCTDGKRETQCKHWARQSELDDVLQFIETSCTDFYRHFTGLWEQFFWKPSTSIESLCVQQEYTPIRLQIQFFGCINKFRYRNWLKIRLCQVLERENHGNRRNYCSGRKFCGECNSLSENEISSKSGKMSYRFSGKLTSRLVRSWRIQYASVARKVINCMLYTE